MSNNDLMVVKEESEARRLQWNNQFENALKAGNLSILPEARTRFEAFLDQQTLRLRRIMGTGDGRALLTAVTNYLVIQKQYVRDVMKPAEGLQPADAEAIARVQQKIVDFSQKERVFLIEINNALVSSPEPTPVGQPSVNPPDDAEEEEPQAPERTGRRKSARTRQTAEADSEEAPRRRKLPHELADDKKRKRNDDEE